MEKKMKLLLILAALPLLAACVTTANSPGAVMTSDPQDLVRVKVLSAKEVTREVPAVGVTAGQIGLGALGALVGAAMGNQVGKGSGKTATTVLGAVAAGAAAVHLGDKHLKSGEKKIATEYVVRRADNDRLQTIVIDGPPQFKAGETLFMPLPPAAPSPPPTIAPAPAQSAASAPEPSTSPPPARTKSRK